MPTCPRCHLDVDPGATTCPAGHFLDGNEWPSLQEFLIGRRLRRIDAARVTRRIAHELARIHAASASHGALSTERVFIDPVTLNVRLGPGLPPPPPLPRSATGDGSGRVRAEPIAGPADDVLALGRIFAALAGDPSASPLQTGEPELDAIAAECARAVPADHPACAELEVKLRNWELTAEREGQRLAATTARIKSDLAPWLQLHERIAEIDPEAGDPTLVEIARRQKIAAEIVAAMDAERARQGGSVAPPVAPPMPVVPVAPPVPVAPVASVAPRSLLAPAPRPSRAGLAAGIAIGALGMALVALAFVHFGGDAPGARVQTPPPPDPPRAVAPPDPLKVAAPPDLAVAAPPAPAVATPVHDLGLAAVPDLGRADAGGTSLCPSGMRLLPGGPYKNVYIHPFCMDVTEVTLADYDACVTEGKCRRRHVTCDEDGFAGTDPEQCDCTRGPKEQTNPANCVTWQAASAFCTAHDKDLPTRDQWHWALHGGSVAPDHAFPWGPKFSPKHACLGRSATCPVGQFESGQTPQGIRDLVGNVAEWTRDHAVNGSSFRDGDTAMDPDARERLDREAWSDSVGFRCVRLP